MSQQAGEQIGRLFAAQDYLAGLRHARALMDGAFRVAPAHRLTGTLAGRERASRLTRAVLRADDALGFRVKLDAPALAG